MTRFTTALRKISPSIPLWTLQLQAPPDLSVLKTAQKNHRLDQIQANENQHAKKSIVYFPSCITRTLGTYEDKHKNAVETVLSICNKTGTNVVIPQLISTVCCSQIFSSKGYHQAQAYSANITIELLWDASQSGSIPVVVDVSSCTHTLLKTRPVLSEENKQKFDRLKILDTIDFLHDLVLPVATTVHKKKKIALHPVCSVKNMNKEKQLLNIAQHFSEEVIVPEHAGCCGMAGDRGFLFPDLTESASALEAAELQDQPCDGYYSTTKTCEMALSEAVKKNYASILYLVDESISPALSLSR